MYIVLSHKVGGILLQQQWETNIVDYWEFVYFLIMNYGEFYQFFFCVY